MENRNENWIPILVIILFISIVGMSSMIDSLDVPTAQEQPVTELELAGPITNPRAELSGLGWHGDTLILLPQYPERFGDGDGALFALSKADIIATLDGTRHAPLEPTQVPLFSPGLKEAIKYFRGFKSIVFNGDQVFLTAESQTETLTYGYLVTGKIAPDSSKITLSTDKVAEIPITFPSGSYSFESILIEDDSVLTLFEVNGAGLNPIPTAHVFDFDLNPMGTIPVPNIEYRLTDAAADSGDSFWVIDLFFPRDSELATGNDPLAEKYGKGPTHVKHDEVERLVEMTYSPDGITLAGTAPVQLVLDGNKSRNLEGLVLLDNRGFLLATNKYPATMLLFVEKSK